MAFDIRQIALAGETTPGGGSPGGTIVEVLQRVLRPYVTSVEVLPTGIGPGNARAVLDGRCELGVMNIELLLAARAGSGPFAADGAADLRVLAHVNHPSWLAIAARRELGLGDLGEVAAANLPLRLRTSGGALTALLLEHYGLSEEVLAAQGGALLAVGEGEGISGPQWATRGEFDVIVDYLHAGYAPRVRHWHDASAANDLAFLPVPDEVARAAFKLGLGEWSNLPAQVVRGLTSPVASVIRHPYAIYGLAEMPNGFARLVAQALDENRAMLRVSNVALSYDPLNVAMSYGAPLHSGAHAYYTSMRYPVGDAAEDHDHAEGEDHSHGPGDSPGHVHLGGTNRLPTLWDRVGVRGLGGVLQGIRATRSGIYATGAAPPSSEADKSAAEEPSWSGGGFGRR